MVKHAVDAQQPLLTADERVRRAFEQVAIHNRFTAEQEKWLDRIRAHLTANLSIDREDFDAVPVLEQAGGWTQASRTFVGRLDTLLRELNAAVAG